MNGGFLGKLIVRDGECLYDDYFVVGPMTQEEAEARADKHIRHFYGADEDSQPDGVGGYYFNLAAIHVSLAFVREIMPHEYDTFIRHGFAKV